MIRKKILILCCYLLVFTMSSVSAEEYSLINFGVVSGGAPSIEKSFNRELQIRLTSIDGLMPTNYDLSQKLKKEADFDNNPVLSKKLVSSLRNNNEDRSIVVWIKIEKSRVVAKRRAVVTAIASGEFKIKLYVYSLYFGEYLYSSVITTNARINKGPLLFRPAEKIIHITASEQIELQNKMAAEAIDKVEVLLTAIVRSELLKSGSIAPPEVKKERAPSVSDMFNIPTAEFEK